MPISICLSKVAVVRGHTICFTCHTICFGLMLRPCCCQYESYDISQVRSINYSAGARLDEIYARRQGQPVELYPASLAAPVRSAQPAVTPGRLYSDDPFDVAVERSLPAQARIRRRAQPRGTRARAGVPLVFQPHAALENDEEEDGDDGEEEEESDDDDEFRYEVNDSGVVISRIGYEEIRIGTRLVVHVFAYDSSRMSL